MIRAFVLAALFVIAGCGPKEQQTPSGDAKALLSEVKDSVAGVSWLVPSVWMAEAGRPMRVTTYVVKATEAGTDPAECAVFYFGSGQGGNVDMNLSRWKSQFQKITSSDQSSRTVNGITVTLLSVKGDYLAPGGPMMESQGVKTGYTLHGAVVEAPDGFVFFKMTGPDDLMESQRGSFDAMIGSLSR